MQVNLGDVSGNIRSEHTANSFAAFEVALSSQHQDQVLLIEIAITDFLCTRFVSEHFET